LDRIIDHARSAPLSEADGLKFKTALRPLAEQAMLPGQEKIAPELRAITNV
jgi:hypothetical protein